MFRIALPLVYPFSNPNCEKGLENPRALPDHTDWFSCALCKFKEDKRRNRETRNSLGWQRRAGWNEEARKSEERRAEVVEPGGGICRWGEQVAAVACGEPQRSSRSPTRCTLPHDTERMKERQGEKRERERRLVAVTAIAPWDRSKLT